MLVQYADALGKAVRGDFGDSTLQLTGAPLLLAVLLGGGLAVPTTYTTHGGCANSCCR